jgi:hypothetical protein
MTDIIVLKDEITFDHIIDDQLLTKKTNLSKKIIKDKINLLFCMIEYAYETPKRVKSLPIYMNTYDPVRLANNFNNKNISLKLYNLRKKIVYNYLYHSITKKKYEVVIINMDILDKYIKKLKYGIDPTMRWFKNETMTYHEFFCFIWNHVS